MKELYLISGPMGIGKTTACRAAKSRLQNRVFLDGDWCWDMNSFQVTEETRRMVMENITFLLNQFLHCSVFDHVLFCWVMHQQEILNDLLSRIDTQNCRVHLVSLVCAQEELEKRVQADIQKGTRQKDALGRSLAYLPLYESLNTCKLDVTGLTAEETAEKIILSPGEKIS